MSTWVGTDPWVGTDSWATSHDAAPQSYSGGSTASTQVTVSGGGTTKRSGGSTATLRTSTSQSGSAKRSGGSAVELSVGVVSAGTTHRVGGYTTTIQTAATGGGGIPAPYYSGGSTALLSLSVSGAGVAYVADAINVRVIATLEPRSVGKALLEPRRYRATLEVQ